MSDQSVTLLEAIRTREPGGHEFGYGIGTAAPYVKQWMKCVGDAVPDSERIIKDSESRLTWCHDDLVVESQERWNGKAEGKIKLPKGIELPANTLMTIQHVLTTSREDRDRDILKTDGAIVDPKMPLLWQHMPPLIIGKRIHTASHTKSKLSLVSVLLDLNELTQDAAKLFEADALRFSHGFRVLDYRERKQEEGSMPSGFEILKFEIMEASAVSVPSNSDCVVELWSRGNLESDVLKRHAKSIWDARTKQSPGFTIPDDESKREKQVTLNGAGKSNATSLVSSGDYVLSESWEQPTAEAENQYIEANGMEAFGKWFLGTRPDAGDETKGKYAYPFTSDFKTVDRAGLIAIRGRAGQQDETAIFEAAGVLIDKIDAMEEEGKAAEPDAKSCSICDGVMELTGESHLCEKHQTAAKCSICGGQSKLTFVEIAGVNKEAGHRYGGLCDLHRYVECCALCDEKATDVIADEIVIGKQAGFTLRRSGPTIGLCKQHLREPMEIDLLRREFGGELQKAGRALSKANEDRLRSAAECCEDVMKMEDVPRAAKALCKEASVAIREVLSAVEGDDEGKSQPLTPRDAVRTLLADAGEDVLRAAYRNIGAVLKQYDDERKAAAYRSFVGK